MQQHDTTSRISIFVPAYNRVALLTRLYNSLLCQSYKNFTLLIVDDGSTDATAETVRRWISGGPIRIRYFYQENGRKHRAYNRAIREVDTELFVDIDSDDYFLHNDAVDTMVTGWDAVDGKDRYCGIQFLCTDPAGKIIGSEFPEGVAVCNAFDLKFRYKVGGDKCIVYHTEKLKQHSLPDLPDAYVMESILHNRVSRLHPFVLKNLPLVVKDYQSDGISRAPGNFISRSLHAMVVLMNEYNYFPLSQRQYLSFATLYVRYSLIAGYGPAQTWRKAINRKPTFIMAFAGGVFDSWKWRLKNRNKR